MRKLRILLQFKYAYYILLFITLLFMIIYLVNYIPPNIYDINDKEFELTIKEYKIDGDKLSIEFNEFLLGNYYFKTLKEKEEFYLELNDKVRFIGNLNNLYNNTIPNTFNYKKYLYNKGIIYTLNIENIELMKKNTNILYKIKNFIYKRISNIKYNDYIYAFVLGKSSFIDSEIYDSYKTNGITHLFSLSALHVSVFSSVLLVIKILSNIWIIFSFLDKFRLYIFFSL